MIRTLKIIGIIFIISMLLLSLFLISALPDMYPDMTIETVQGIELIWLMMILPLALIMMTIIIMH